jgi:hypothetical protein
MLRAGARYAAEWNTWEQPAYDRCRASAERLLCFIHDDCEASHVELSGSVLGATVRTYDARQERRGHIPAAAGRNHRRAIQGETTEITTTELMALQFARVICRTNGGSNVPAGSWS